MIKEPPNPGVEFDPDNDDHAFACMRCGCAVISDKPVTLNNVLTAQSRGHHCKHCSDFRKAAFAADPELKRKEEEWMNR